VRIARAASVDRVLFAHAATTAPPGATWRIGEIETDASVLFCRCQSPGEITRLAWVDGSIVRTAGARRLLVSVPAPAADLHLDLMSHDGEARLSGPNSSARVQVGGKDVAIESERRGAARLKGVR
jgi:hypothetical protein